MILRLQRASPRQSPNLQEMNWLVGLVLFGMSNA
jgi:hypothetical protein